MKLNAKKLLDVSQELTGSAGRVLLYLSSNYSPEEPIILRMKDLRQETGVTGIYGAVGDLLKKGYIKRKPVITEEGKAYHFTLLIDLRG